ncbi:MAG: 23S rRNA (uracil(1939)-C(5))-methyltransferase RlmD [Candidatus Acidiferrales bacterium]
MNVNIEKLIYGGDGLAHHEGSTVFVPYVLPGEVVTIVPTKWKKKFVRGLPETIMTASPERIAAACPHFLACGGCHYQQMGYESQLPYKEQILQETLRRIGKIDWTGPIAVHASPPWQYRNRAQWKVRDTDPPLVGYFRAGTTSVVDVESCPVLSPRLFGVLEEAKKLFAAGSLPPTLREVEAFVDDRDESLMLTLTLVKLAPAVCARVEKVLTDVAGAQSLLFQDTNQNRMQLFGSGSLKYRVGDFDYRVSHFSFFQVNRFLAAELASCVAEAAGSGRLALDLYSGVGLFSLPLGRQFERVIAVESNPVAVSDFKANAAAAGGAASGKFDSREADTLDFLRKLRERPQCVVLDPPRAGLGPEGAMRLAKLSPEKIIYVSCDPATLARDLAVLTAEGHAISVVHLFDLFPQTFHIESVVQLVRR